MSNTARAADTQRHLIGLDVTLADAYDPAYIDSDDVEDVDLMTREQRQALNLRMSEWFNG